MTFHRPVSQEQSFTEPIRSSFALISELESFSEVLTRFQFEGKCSFARNVLAIHDCLKVCRFDFSRHLSVEERIVFPFLDGHIPKFNSLIRFFSSEHRMLIRLLDEMEQIHEKICQRNQPLSARAMLVVEFREAANQFIGLLKHHLKEELEKIYCELKYYLKHREYRELQDELGGFEQEGSLKSNSDL